jgi:hypothetical protein
MRMEWNRDINPSQGRRRRRCSIWFFFLGANVLMILERDKLGALDSWEKCIKLLARNIPCLQPSNDNDILKNPGACSKPLCVSRSHSILVASGVAVFQEQTLQQDDHSMLPLDCLLLSNTLALLQHPSEATHHRIPDEGSMALTLTLHMKLPTEILSKLLAADSHATLDMTHPGLGI